MADIYNRFQEQGDYYDMNPQDLIRMQASYRTDAGIPTANRVMNVGRNDYNMQGTLDAEQRYGIPRVMVQSSPYARTAFTYGPSGPIPLIGATSVYPHVVSSGWYDYGAPYMAQAFAMPNDGYSFDKLMAYVKDISRMQMRPRGGGGTGTGTSGTPKKADDVALPPEGDGEPKPIPIRPRVPQLEVPEALPAPKDPLAPSNTNDGRLTIQAYRANDPNNPYRKNGSVGVPDLQGMTPPQPAPELVPNPVIAMPDTLGPYLAPDAATVAPQQQVAPAPVPVTPQGGQYLVPNPVVDYTRVAPPSLNDVMDAANAELALRGTPTVGRRRPAILNDPVTARYY